MIFEEIVTRYNPRLKSKTPEIKDFFPGQASQPPDCLGRPEQCLSVHRGKQRCGDIYRFAHFWDRRRSHPHIVPTFIAVATTLEPGGPHRETNF